MGNCLITQLKGNVDDNNLVKYGQTVLKVYNTDSDSMYLVIDIGSASWTDTIVTGSNITVLSNHFVKLGTSANPYEVRITNKYNIKGIDLSASSSSKVFFTQTANHHVSFKYWDDALYNGLSNEPKSNVAIRPDTDGNIKNLKGYSTVDYASSMTDGYLVPIKGDVADMVSANTRSVDFQNSAKNIYGNISAFAVCSNLQHIKITADLNWISGGSNLTGDIASLVPCTNLSDRVIFDGTKVYGKLENLVAGQAASRTSGGFNVAIRNTQITLNDATRNNLGWLHVTFTATGAEIRKEQSPNTLYATYTKSSNTWQYQNLN